MPESESKSVLITGVSSGIGWGLAHAYLAAECRVLGISRRQPEDLMANPQFGHLRLDVTQEDAIVGAFAQWLDEHGGVDIAILNAGQLGRLGDMADLALDDFRDVMNVNVWSNKSILDVLLTRRLVRRQVVTISSGASVNGNRGFAGYSISKSALNMLTKLYAREFAGVHFCALAPGVVDTAMQAALSDQAEDDRFDAFRRLRELRQSGGMPDAREASGNLVRIIDSLPQLVASGDYADIREARFDGSHPGC